jgi:glycerol uptake facilitator-like aquaporin
VTTPFDMPRRLVAEGLGTALLVAIVVGSGIMAETMSRDDGVRLLANTLATGAGLVVLITILGPISGAHFNPAVSAVMTIERHLAARDLAPFVVVQVLGGIVGTLAAHAMFGMALVEFSTKARTGFPQWFAEFVATFGLVTTILLGARHRREALPWLVGLYITAAYWFTASTSFANPAVTIARAFTESFAGIAPADVPGFILAQLAGALAGWGLCRWMSSASDAKP